MKALQSLLPGSDAAWMPYALVTIIRCKGSSPREPGASMTVFPDGSSKGTIGGGALEQAMIQQALTCLAEGQPRLISSSLGTIGQCCGGSVEVFVNVFNTGPRLFLFGAGHVGSAAARLLADTPFQVTIIDGRSDIIAAGSWPEAVKVVCEDPQVFASKPSFPPDQDSYIAVMTHDHRLDQDILAALLRKPMRYLGLIGSKDKWKKFRHRLAALGFSEQELDKVICPLGLPLGGKSPAEVAISLAAQLLQLHYHATT